MKITKRTVSNIVLRMGLLLIIFIPMLLLFHPLFLQIFSPTIANVVSIALAYLLARFVMFVFRFEKMMKKAESEDTKDASSTERSD